MRYLRLLCLLFPLWILTGCSQQQQNQPQLGGPDTTFVDGVLWNNTVYESVPGTVASVGKRLGTVEQEVNSALPSSSDATVSNVFPVGTKIYAELGQNSSKYIVVLVPSGNYMELEAIQYVNQH